MRSPIHAFLPTPYFFSQIIFAAPDWLPLALTDKLQNAEPSSEVITLVNWYAIHCIETSTAKKQREHLGIGTAGAGQNWKRPNGSPKSRGRRQCKWANLDSYILARLYCDSRVLSDQRICSIIHKTI